MDLCWFYLYYKPCQVYTPTITSDLTTPTILGMKKSPSKPTLEASPNPYLAKSTLVGHTCCKGGSLSIVILYRTQRPSIHNLAALTVLDYPVSVVTPSLDILYIWFNASSTSSPDLFSNRIHSITFTRSCFYTSGLRYELHESRLKCTPFKKRLQLL